LPSGTAPHVSPPSHGVHVVFFDFADWTRRGRKRLPGLAVFGGVGVASFAGNAAIGGVMFAGLPPPTWCMV
jgi:hypothetical protein